MNYWTKKQIACNGFKGRDHPVVSLPALLKVSIPYRRNLSWE